jgi:ATP phosphoribosyltransferase regulatory subunit
MLSKPKVFEKPIGLKDYLPEAVSKLRTIETNVLACMQRWGYQQIITPTLEYYDTVGVASSTEDKKLFKLLDRHGATLVMRSEMTSPIARVVASLLRNEALPLRLSYHSPVFRAIELEAGRDAEFYQTGLELIGDGSPEADAEVVALAIASLQAAGVTSFKIAIGHIGFLNGLFADTLKDSPDTEALLKSYLMHRDVVGYRAAVNNLQLAPPIAQALGDIHRLRGDSRVCQQALLITSDPVAQQSIHHLSKVWEVLEAYGVSDFVTIDLTMIGDFSYYTGVVFEGYASEHGFPVCSGGRYDNLLAQFGRPSASTGFALKTSRILELLDKVEVEDLSSMFIMYDEAHRKQALQLATKRRNEQATAVVTYLIDNERGGIPTIEQLPSKAYLVHGRKYQEVIQLLS